MVSIVEILASVLCSGIGVAFFVVFSIRRRLHRSNRLVAGRRSVAPSSWIWSPRRAAVLHRRLQSCCQVAIQAAAETGPSAAPAGRRLMPRRRPSAPGPFERLASDMITQAVDLDARLVAADRRSGPLRRQTLAEVAAEVHQLESFAHRMDTLARAWRAQLTGPQPANTELGDRLDALDATLHELRIPGPAADPVGTRWNSG